MVVKTAQGIVGVIALQAMFRQNHHFAARTGLVRKPCSPRALAARGEGSPQRFHSCLDNGESDANHAYD